MGDPQYGQTNQADVDALMSGIGSGGGTATMDPPAPEPTTAPTVAPTASAASTYPTFDKVKNSPQFTALNPQERRQLLGRWVNGSPSVQGLSDQERTAVINRAQSLYPDDAHQGDLFLDPKQVKKQFDVSYVYGGDPESSKTDCSGFMCQLYKRNGVPNLPRTADAQYKANNGVVINDPNAIQPGDQLFFTGTNGHNDGTASHTGFYLGTGPNGEHLFVHNSSTKGGVTVSDLRSYPLQWLGAKRYSYIDQIVQQRAAQQQASAVTGVPPQQPAGKKGLPGVPPALNSSFTVNSPADAAMLGSVAGASMGPDARQASDIFHQEQDQLQNTYNQVAAGMTPEQGGLLPPTDAELRPAPGTGPPPAPTPQMIRLAKELGVPPQRTPEGISAHYNAAHPQDIGLGETMSRIFSMPDPRMAQQVAIFDGSNSPIVQSLHEQQQRAGEAFANVPKGVMTSVAGPGSFEALNQMHGAPAEITRQVVGMSDPMQLLAMVATGSVAGAAAKAVGAKLTTSLLARGVQPEVAQAVGRWAVPGGLSAAFTAQAAPEAARKFQQGDAWGGMATLALPALPVAFHATTEAFPSVRFSRFNPQDGLAATFDEVAPDGTRREVFGKFAGVVKTEAMPSGPEGIVPQGAPLEDFYRFITQDGVRVVPRGSLKSGYVKSANGQWVQMKGSIELPETPTETAPTPETPPAAPTTPEEVPNAAVQTGQEPEAGAEVVRPGGGGEVGTGRGVGESPSGEAIGGVPGQPASPGQAQGVPETQVPPAATAPPQGVTEPVPVVPAGPATWTSGGVEHPVNVTGPAGVGPDGRQYVNIEGGAAAIPADEVSPVVVRSAKDLVDVLMRHQNLSAEQAQTTGRIANEMARVWAKDTGRPIEDWYGNLRLNVFSGLADEQAAEKTPKTPEQVKEKKVRTIKRAVEAIQPVSAVGVGNVQSPSQEIATQGSLKPNTVMRKLVANDGTVLGVITEPYDGTIAGVKKAAETLENRMRTEYPKASGIQSLTAATGAQGQPSWVVSPNRVHVAPANTTDARYIFGDVSAIPPSDSSKSGMIPAVPAQPSAPPVQAQPGATAASPATPPAREPGAVERQTEVAPQAAPGQTDGAKTLADWVFQKLENGSAIGNVTKLNELAEQAWMATRTSGVWTPKDAFDAMEAGVNRYLARYGEKLMNMDGIAGLKELRDLMALITSQGVRTEEQIKNQQFSTPPTESYVAAKVANLKPTDVVLEPSAGNGGLAVWPKSVGAKVYVNEIAPRRQEMLRIAGFGEPSAVDGEYINALLDPNIKPTVILMNPPFSASTMKSHEAKNSSKYGFNHVEQALQRLEPGGRLVAILGGGQANEPNGGASLTGGQSGAWFGKIARQYNIRANVRIDGKEYQKYGTNFATRIIVIDKDGATPAGQIVQGNFKTLEEAYEALRSVQDSRPELAQQPQAGPVGGASVGESQPGVGVAGNNPAGAASGGRGTRPSGSGGGQNPVAAGNTRHGRPDAGPLSNGPGVGNQLPPRAEPGPQPSGPVAQGAPAGGVGGGSAHGGTIESPQLTPAPTGEPPTIRESVEQFQAQAASGNAASALEALKAAAKARLAARNEPPTKLNQLEEMYPLYQSAEDLEELDPLDLADYSMIGAANIGAGITDEASWRGAMISDLGPNISPYLDEIWAKTKAAYNKYVRPALGVDAPEPGAPMQPPVGSSDQGVAIEAENPATIAEEDTSAYVTYQPSIKGPAHPGKLVETKAMSTVSLPPITYQPSLPGVMDKGLISAPQMEPVALAGQQNEIRLPNGARAGFLEGDGTGVGKGRIGSAILLDNWNKGRTRLVWVTKSWDLVEAAKRDLMGIGAHDLANAVLPLRDLKGDAAIDHRGVLVTTYGLTRSEDKKGNSRIAQIEQWTRGDDNSEGAYILFDESHLLKNAVAMRGTKPSQIGVTVKEYMDRNPNLRTTSMSATAATDVMNLGYLDRLGLWGPGTPFPNGFMQFASQIADGGMSAMEMIARELKAQGKFISRTLSYKGVTYSEVEHVVTPEQKEIYRSASKAWKAVSARVESTIADTTGGGALQRNRFMSQFYSTQQRFFGVLLTTLKIPTALAEANRAIADGKAVVITLVNTNEAAQNREKNKYRGETEDGEEEIPEYDFGPGEMLVELVREHYPVQQFVDDVDDQGNAIKRPMTRPGPDGKEMPVNNPQAERERDALIQDLRDNLHMPANPLDLLIDGLGGHKNVAELTGRKERYDAGTGQFISRGDPGVARKDINLTEMQHFQDGKKLIAVLSGAADTGISLHASNQAKNQRQRYHITLQLGWSADKAMQMLGRTHRTDQASAPEYALLKTNLGGENRFISTIARRLSSLEALGKGQTNTNEGTEMMSKVNFESDQGQQSANIFYTRLLTDIPVPGANMSGMDILEDMGVLKMDSQTQRKTVPKEDRTNVPRLLNRLLALDPDVQNAVYDYYYDLFTAVVEKAVEDGTLDTGVRTLPGDEFTVKEERVIATDPKTGAATYYYPVEASVRTNRVSPADLQKLIKGHLKNNPRVMHNDKGRLALVIDANPIVHADGRVEEAIFVISPDNGNWRKVEATRLGRMTEVGEGANNQVSEAEKLIADKQRMITNTQRYVDQGYGEHWIKSLERYRSELTDLDQKLADAKERADGIDTSTPEGMASLPEWKEQYDNAPATKTQEHHFVGGAIMRYWTPVKDASGGRLRIFSTSDSKTGKRVVGADIPPDAIAQLLERITGNKGLVDARQIISDVYNNGMTYQLEGGIRIKTGRVSGQKVVELIPPNPEVASTLNNLGVIYEKGIMPVYYVGTSAEQARVLDKVLEQFPAAGLTDTTTLYQRSDAERGRTPAAEPRYEIYSHEGDRLIVPDAGEEMADRARKMGYRVTPKMPDQVESGAQHPETYLQEPQTGPKGEPKASIEFQPGDRDALISLGRLADVTSITHEMFHMARRRLAESAAANETAKADYDTLSEWAGAKQGANGEWTWNEKAEEKAARGWERYWWEGKSPTEALAEVFARMKAWFRKTYKSLKGSSLDVDLNDAIRRVFGRMLGAEDEIPSPIEEPIEKTTGVAHRVHEARAEAGDALPIERGEGISAEAQVKRGQEALRQGADAQALADDILSSHVKAVTGDEMAILRAYHAKLSAAADRAADAYHDEETPENKQKRDDALEAERAWAQDVIKPMQTEWHKVGMAQQGETGIETGSFTSIARAYTDAIQADGDTRPMTKAEIDRAQGYAEDVKRLEGELVELQAKLDDALAGEPEPETAATTTRRTSTTTRSKSKTATATPVKTKEIRSLLEEFRAAGEAKAKLNQEPEAPAADTLFQRPEPTMTDEQRDIAREIAKQLIHEGLRSEREVTAALHSYLSEIIPNITENEIREAVSRYGETTQPNPDPDAKTFREIAGQMRLIEAIRDAEDKIRPLKSGFQRDKMSDEIRGLRRHLNEAMRSSGVDTTARSPEEKMATALDAVNTRIDHEIADLTKEIETGERVTPTKTPTQLDKATQVKKAERDRLKAIRDALFHGDMTEAKIAAAMRGLAKTMENTRRRINTGDIKTQARNSDLWSPELGKMRKEHQALQGVLKQMRKDARVPKPPKPTDKLPTDPVKLAEHFATRMADGSLKSPKDFTLPEIRAIWNHAKNQYLDLYDWRTRKSASFPDMLEGVARDLGLKPEWVRSALASNKSAREVSDAMYKNMADRRDAIKRAKAWVDAADVSKARKVAAVIGTLPRATAVFGHGTVGMTTHAGLNIMRPSGWKAYWPAFFQQFPVAFPLSPERIAKATHERLMQGIEMKPDYVMKLRAGLSIDPNKQYDNIQEYSRELGRIGGWIGRMGVRGDRGMDLLKVYRDNLFDLEWSRLPEELRTPETAKLLADSINHTSGSGHIDTGYGAISGAVKGGMFAPSKTAAEWARLVGDPIKTAAIGVKMARGKATLAERAIFKLRMKRTAELAAVYVGLLAANYALQAIDGQDDKVNMTDPTKSDFFKFKWNGRTYDPTGGAAGPLVFVASVFAHMIHGNRYEAVHDVNKYVQNKLGPQVSVPIELAFRKDAYGRLLPTASEADKAKAQQKGKPAYGWGEYLGEHGPIPLSGAIREYYDALREEGIDGSTASAMARAAVVLAIEQPGVRVGKTPVDMDKKRELNKLMRGH